MIIHLTPSHMALREKVIAVGCIAGMSALSAMLYDHRQSAYAAGKSVKLASARSFSYIYRYIQVSTIICSLGGCLFYDRALLDIHDSTSIFYCGLAVAVAGIALFSYAKVTLATNYSPCFDSYLPHSVTANGAYRYIRHPIYVANILVLVGAFVMSGSLWIIPNIALAAYFYHRAAVNEESELSQHIADYVEYRKATGRFFPRLNMILKRNQALASR